MFADATLKQVQLYSRRTANVFVFFFFFLWDGKGQGMDL